VVFILVHLFVVLYEEPTLARRHPEEYPRFKRNVPRWLPRLTPWNDTGSESAR
jgi:protein-S-isoprenylcysteine O-methyltransferase Ste14